MHFFRKLHYFEQILGSAPPLGVKTLLGPPDQNPGSAPVGPEKPSAPDPYFSLVAVGSHHQAKKFLLPFVVCGAGGTKRNGSVRFRVPSKGTGFPTNAI